MSFQPVEAVFFWRYTMDSIFRMIYGRFPPPSPYTKDYLQTSGDQRAVLEQVLGYRGADVPVRLTWPGASRQGNYRRATKDPRGHLAWLEPGGPLPWRLGDPAAEVEITLPGDRNRATPADADAELARLRALDLDPWIIAVKLHGEPGVLHVRAYVGNPPAGQEARSLGVLPSSIRAAIREVPATSTGDALAFARVLAPGATQRILATLERNPNVLLVGPPGTGKTVALEDMRSLFKDGGRSVMFAPQRWEDAWAHEINLPSHSGREAISLVFHPAYSYEDFVAGLVPHTDGEGRLRLTARPGPLISLGHWASDAGRAALLVLDEFNRGPAAAIFGDTLALLDEEKRRSPEKHRPGAAIQRPYPSYSMRVPDHYANAGGRTVEQQLSLPRSLWLLAALNSTDRSVAPLDAALRRRFSILHVGPDYSALSSHLGIPEPADGVPFAAAGAAPTAWSGDDVKALAVHLLRALNERIGFVMGQDFLLGHALFWPVAGSTAAELAGSLVRTFDERVAATLRLTFVDQDEALATILNVPIPTPDDGAPRAGRWMEPPDRLQAVAPARLELTEIASMDWPRAMSALVALLA